MRIIEPSLPGHQGTLRKAAHNRLIGWIPLRAKMIEQLENLRAAAENSRSGLTREVVPGKATEIGVRRIDQEIIQPWKLQRGGQPAITRHAISQSMHHDQQSA